MHIQDFLFLIVKRNSSSNVLFSRSKAIKLKETLMKHVSTQIYFRECI